jgi:F0F1-type ATP synthase membrane subunit c/vacuolar-type H+-ATPase subunit K
MPRYATANGAGTNVEAQALKNAKGVALSNPAREVWIQETALSTALNSSYMATQVGLFGIVVGIALLLSGLGFGILAMSGALRNPDSVLRLRRRASAIAAASTPAPSGA